jgi:hypothetical protein
VIWRSFCHLGNVPFVYLYIHTPIRTFSRVPAA